MAGVIIYDKVKWHTEKGATLLEATSHLKRIMQWLHDNQLLTELGQEIYELGIDQEFSLTSAMVVENGQDLLDRNYADWVRSFGYGEVPSLEIFERDLHRE